jgi:hypothetical protein
MYTILTAEKSNIRTELTRGITKMVQEHSKHPAVIGMIHCRSAIVEKAMVIAAIYAEPDFLTYAMEQPGMCSSTLSEYVAHVLPDLVERLLDGKIAIVEFVQEATHAYVKL